MNLLKEVEIKTKIEELLGKTPTDLILDVVWDSLNKYFGYEIDLQEREDFLKGMDSYTVFPSFVNATELLEVKMNDIEQDITDFSIVKDNMIKSKNFIIGDTVTGRNSLNSANYEYTDLYLKYNAGYTVETFPNDLVLACSLLYNKTEFGVGCQSSLKSYKVNKMSYSLKDEVEQSKPIADILQRYLG